MDGTELTTVVGLGGGFAVLALVEVVKRSADLPERTFKRWVLLLAVLLGIGWNWLVLSVLRAPDTRWVLLVFLGIQSGLSGMGLWSSAKAQAEASRPDPGPNPG